MKSLEEKVFFVLCHNGIVYVKEEAFFVSQGGLTEDWGKDWIKVKAFDMEEARDRGRALKKKTRTPGTNPPAPMMQPPTRKIKEGVYVSDGTKYSSVMKKVREFITKWKTRNHVQVTPKAYKEIVKQMGQVQTRLIMVQELFNQECNDVDALLIRFNLNPDDFRTDMGNLKVQKAFLAITGKLQNSHNS
jgi:hypothetical protein